MTLKEAKEAVKRFEARALDASAPVSGWIRKAVARNNRDLARIGQPDFPYFFDEDAAYHVIEVINYMKFTEGAWMGKPFELLDWQVYNIWLAYGWLTKEQKTRKHRKIYIKVARKNGKTEYLSTIGTYGQSFDPQDSGCKIYWFATKKEQAKIGFDRQAQMVRRACADSPAIANALRVMQYRIVDRDGPGFTTYLGKDSKGEDGHNPFYGLCDEYHAHPTDDMMHVIETGMMSRKSPMLWIITTAGSTPDGPCGRFERVCKQILDDIIDDDSILPLIFDLDEGDDWENPAVWGKANPGLGVSVTMENLMAAYKKAKTEGVTALMNFQIKNLNIWQKAKVVWIQAKTWAACGREKRDDLIEAMKGQLCFGGLDLASSSDLCSLVLLFPPSGERLTWVILHWSWAPEETIDRRVRLDSAPYLQFLDRGELMATEGDSTDYELIKARILQCADDYGLHSVAYDRYNSYKLIPELVDEGIKMEPFSQSFPAMNAPTVTTEVWAKKGYFETGKDSLLAWAISNVTTVKKNDLVKPVKDKSQEKIDPAVALVMAVGQAHAYISDIDNDNIDPMLIINV